MKKTGFVFYIIVFIDAICFGQNIQQTLNAEQLLQIVKQFHPVVKQSVINIEKSKAAITTARGAFDPILSHISSKKTFGGVNYYNYSNPSIQIPTWYGVEFSAGLENLSGNRFDPSETIGKTNYIGVSIPLIKNLVIDKRRAALQQAKIYNSMAEVEQKAIINNILMEAITQYWEWVNAYQIYLIVKNNVVVNEKRLELIKKSYVNGERAAIDTTEALTQLQSFQYQQNENWLAFQNAGLELSAFLWQNNNTPFQLPDTVIPPKDWENESEISDFILNLAELLEIAEKSHPELQIYNYKIDVLGIDKKLKFQELLPKLDFKYNQFSKGFNTFETLGPIFENNFQYGLKLEMPLLFRQAKGIYKQAKLKIDETILDQNQKKLSIELKVKTYHNQFLMYKNQIALQSNNYSNYKKLVSAEETKLLNGESTLFLLNSRENKALDALEKLVALKTKYYKTFYALQWSAGLLN